MPDGIRSHRHRGSRRRRAVAPWVVLTVLTLVGTTGVSLGYAHVIRGACSGELRVRLIAAPAVADILDGLARSWSGSEPEVGRRCAVVEVDGRDTAAIVRQLVSGWDDKAGPAPDVWVPESTAWVRRAAASPPAAAILPSDQTSIARSPAVVAMPKPMAEALGWPQIQPSWQDLIQAKHPAAAGWAGTGNADWGEFRLGMTDPLRSTAGLHTLMAVLDANTDGEISGDESGNLTRLRAVQKVYAETVDAMLADLRRADERGSVAALRHVSAFPALECEVVAYNLGHPRVPLVAVYPRDTTDADHPYLVLNTPWSDPARQEVAYRFLDYVRGPAGRSKLMAAGFRDADGNGGDVLSDGHGTAPRVQASTQAMPPPAAVKRSIEVWSALTRITNVLLVLDVSGSMGLAVSGPAKTRLALVRAAARSTISLLSDDSSVGLWLFASRMDGTSDHIEAVPSGRLTEPAAGAATRRVAVSAALDRIAAGGNSALYDTVVAAHHAVSDAYRDGARNLVVVVTDGGNDDDTGGATLNQTIEALGGDDPAHAVQVVTIGFGPDADTGALRAISRASGAVSYPVGLDADLGSALQTAVLAE
jgi:Ca-activated chloride channel homolog